MITPISMSNRNNQKTSFGVLHIDNPQAKKLYANLAINK